MSAYHETNEIRYFSNRFTDHISSSSYKQLVAESVVLSAVIYAVIVLKFRQKKRLRLSEQQKDRIIAGWRSEALVPETEPDHPALQTHHFEGKVCKYAIYDGLKYFNLASTNFLGLIGDAAVEKAAKAAIAKYGVGSCGPRGFYGTVDIHLALEKQIANFLGCEEAVLYSYGFATVASAIPSYAKRGDVIFADKGVNFAVQKGLKASRSRIEWFDHNDVNDLERLLLRQAAKDREDSKLASTTRRFIVVEGLYVNSGDLCPLPELMALKWKYKVRIFIDESLSIGAIGRTGRGVTEHFGIDVVDCDMIMGSLEHAFASTGGFCAGRTFVVNHQRLSGLGYCFSASLPPLLAAAASKGMDIINSEPERLLRLHHNCKLVNDKMKEALSGTGFVVRGDPQSPLQFIYSTGSAASAEGRLDKVVALMRRRGYLMTRMRYLPEEAFLSEPSIRLSIQSEMTEEELLAFIEALRGEAQKVD